MPAIRAFDLFAPICFRLPIVGQFCFGARIDITTITHLFEGLLVAGVFHLVFAKLISENRTGFFIALALTAGIVLGEELAQGSCSVQGFDFIDLLSGFGGIAIYAFIQRKRFGSRQ